MPELNQSANPMASIQTMPVSVIVGIVSTLCHTNNYGGHVNEEAYRMSVYNLFLACPSLYFKALEDPKFVLIANLAASENNLAKFYDDMADQGGYNWEEEMEDF